MRRSWETVLWGAELDSGLRPQGPKSHTFKASFGLSFGLSENKRDEK